MKSFKQFCKEEFLLEKLITFGGQAYPKFGQVVILAGGGGSGKGFQLSNLLGIEGHVFDVDALKALAIGSKKFSQKVKDETGHDIKNFDLKKPENVSRLHDILANVYGITKADQQRVFGSVLAANPNRKPNLIFDVTLKDINKFRVITERVKELGYDPKNIHLVWVINDITIAIEQNQTRNRRVPEEILLSTHQGASLTMRQIISKDFDIQKYLDGDIWFTFNKAKIDTELKKSDKGGSYVAKANYVKIKAKGKKPLKYQEVSAAIIEKIKRYTPDIKLW